MSETSEDWFDLLSRLRALEQQMWRRAIDDIVRRIEVLESSNGKTCRVDSITE